MKNFATQLAVRFILIVIAMVFGCLAFTLGRFGFNAPNVSAADILFFGSGVFALVAGWMLWAGCRGVK